MNCVCQVSVPEGGKKPAELYIPDHQSLEWDADRFLRKIKLEYHSKLEKIFSNVKHSGDFGGGSILTRNEICSLILNLVQIYRTTFPIVPIVANVISSCRMHQAAWKYLFRNTDYFVFQNIVDLLISPCFVPSQNFILAQLTLVSPLPSSILPWHHPVYGTWLIGTRILSLPCSWAAPFR